MSEDEEDYDELPPITVTSSARDSSSFSMPCASELAEQRAREERCELEIRRLRAERAPPPSDSSGEEGEAALAAAVRALRVRAGSSASPASPAPAPPPRLAALLAAAAPRLPRAPFTERYLSAARAAADRSLDGLHEAILESIIGMDASDAWEAGALEAAGAWLCAALATREGRRLGPRLARAAQRLLDDGAADAQVAVLSEALGAALPPARALELSDALRSGGARAEALADALLAGAGAALHRAEEGVERAWRRLDAHEQYVGLQLAGRAHAHAPPGPPGAAPPAALHALLATTPSARDQHPDTLKVLVAASKLQVLFQINK